MKKFKLIKEYPNCGNPLNVIVKELTNGKGYWDGSKVYNKNIIEKHPEFWEEVIEKDYEILSYYQESNVHGKHVYLNLHVNWEHIVKQNYKIHSVKRLSDGEIFTVDDEVKSIHWYEEIPFTTIEGFHINKHMDCKPIGSMIIEVKGYCRDKSNWLSLEKSMKNHKKPLFTTEDGVDIFIGDSYWTLNTKVDDWIFEELAARDNINYFYKNKDYAKNTGIYYFSTKEAAEEYLLMNKPCLSINDVLNVTYNPVETKTSTTRKLKQIVKKQVN